MAQRNIAVLIVLRLACAGVQVEGRSISINFAHGSGSREVVRMALSVGTNVQITQVQRGFLCTALLVHRWYTKSAEYPWTFGLARGYDQETTMVVTLALTVVEVVLGSWQVNGGMQNTKHLHD